MSHITSKHLFRYFISNKEWWIELHTYILIGETELKRYAESLRHDVWQGLLDGGRVSPFGGGFARLLCLRASSILWLGLLQGVLVVGEIGRIIRFGLPVFLFPAPLAHVYLTD